MNRDRSTVNSSAVLLAAGVVVGFLIGNSIERTSAQDGKKDKPKSGARELYSTAKQGGNYLRQSPAARANRPATDYGLGENHVSKLPTYPLGGPGDRTPLDLWRYAGGGDNSWGSPNLPMPWDRWVEKMREQKPKLMTDVNEYMDSRYDFSGNPMPGATMTGGRPIMHGPIARLPKGTKSWEALTAMSPGEIKKADAFPFKPLAHPLQTTAHMLFPQAWVQAHPEHERMDVDFDIPNAYLPEFPPPMFLTTHKELGDVSQGKEVTLGNYYELFNGLLTGEQMEGLKELLRPSATTWFNQTEHRVTYEPSAGVACRELLKHLATPRCVLVREGAKHSWWGNPLNGRRSAVPRHVELSNQMATKICKDLGVPRP